MHLIFLCVKGRSRGGICGAKADACALVDKGGQLRMSDLKVLCQLKQT